MNFATRSVPFQDGWKGAGITAAVLGIGWCCTGELSEPLAQRGLVPYLDV
jgi:hypothetical protein